MTVESNQDWLKLDNAAKIYPAASSKDAPAVFRLSTTFDKPIRIAALQQAYASVLARCPYFQVYLRRGVFWYYLQKHNQAPTIQLLDRFLRLGIPIHQRNTPLLRVQARGASMAIDFSHILTDGIGGMRFLTSVVAEYFRLSGIVVERWDTILDPQDEPQPEEFEDGYRQHFDSGLPTPPKLSPAYHLPGEVAGTIPYRILSGRMPLSDVLALAKSHEVSLTEYLVALYMDAIARVREQELNIPLIIFVDTPGFLIGTEVEKKRAPGKIINFMNALSLCTVPKLSVVLRKSYGQAYLNMGGSRNSDEMAVWPTAEISFMDPQFAVQIVHGVKDSRYRDQSSQAF